LEQEPKKVEADLLPPVEPAGTAPSPAPAAAADDAPSTGPSVWFPSSEQPAEAAPPAWNGAAADTPAREYPPAPAAEPRDESARTAPSGPNLMLAVVCWVAAATSLFEAYALYVHQFLHSYAFNGYMALGAGLLLFSLEAFSWPRAYRRWMNHLFVPAALLTLLGVICLVLSQSPGRRI
jgi:hypothetical protein